MTDLSALAEKVEGLTHAQFAERAARIASVATSWAADTLIMPRWFDKPMRPEDLDRFCEAIRFHLDCLEKDAALLRAKGASNG